MNENDTTNEAVDGKREQPDLDGVLVFLLEICHLSYSPNMSCFCTPGHQRGTIAALLDQSYAATFA